MSLESTPYLGWANIKSDFLLLQIAVGMGYASGGYSFRGITHANRDPDDVEYHMVIPYEYQTFLYAGVEYSISKLAVRMEEITLTGLQAYGSLGATIPEVPAIRIVHSSDPTPIIFEPPAIQLDNKRVIKEVEVLFYFTRDGRGVVKKIKMTLFPSFTSKDQIQSIKVLNFVGVTAGGIQSIGAGPDSNPPVNYFHFSRNPVGFNYETLAEYNTDWTTDVGLTVSIGRKTPHPNLLPDFNGSEWQNPATVVDARTLALAAGDDTYITVLNAFPDNREHWFNFEVQNNTGQVYIEFSLVRNVKDTITNAKSITLTTDGPVSLPFDVGYGYTWLYVRFRQDSGTSWIYEPHVTYQTQTVLYKAPDNSHLANRQMRNCIRVQSSNPSGKRLTRALSENVKIADGKGVGITIRSLDNIDIQNGAFKLIFQKPDNTWVSSAKQNLFVDYNEKYDPVTKGNAIPLHMWEDGIFGIDVPDGVDEIKGIGIEWVTSNSIDWLLDDFFTLNWQSSFSSSLGFDERKRFGPSVVGLRATDWSLRGTLGIIEKRESTTYDNIKIKKGISFTVGRGVGLPAVYVLDGTNKGYTIDSPYVIDRGYELEIYTVIENYYNISSYVGNSRTREAYKVKKIITEPNNVVRIFVDVETNHYTEKDVIYFGYSYLEPLPAVGGGYTNFSVQPGQVTGVLNHPDGLFVFPDGTTIEPDDLGSIVAVCQDVPITGAVYGAFVVGNNHDVTTLRMYGLDPKLPWISTYLNMVFTDKDNITAETSFIYYPTRGYDLGDSLYSLAQSTQDELQGYTIKTRTEPLTPLPRNYNLIPHIAFGGEQIAAQPISYIKETAERLAEAGTSNAIVSAGSLAYLRDKDLSSWWWWGGSLRDNSIDYLKATRDMLRQGNDEITVSNNISSHRYFFEVTTFAYEHNKRYRTHADIDYKGDEKFKRVWYYQNSEGLYTARVHAWDDFQESYYNPISIGVDELSQLGQGEDPGGPTEYTFQYHYTLVIPAFWSIVTSKSEWPGMEEDTIYDLMAKRIDYLCKTYDTDGIIISEMIHYKMGFSSNDSLLYGTWCQNNGFGVQTDWPRFSENNYIDPDDATKVWPWKRYQVKKFLTEMSTIAHAHNKLLGVNVLAQNIFSITNPNNPIWAPYTPIWNDKYKSWHVDTLDHSLDRYGTNYAELLDENIVDVMYVWLYYKYGVIGQRAVTEFMEKFSQYKDRMFLTVGLFPKEDPPSECEVVALLKMLLGAGWNVAYAGYPPMLIQDSRWKGVWSKVKPYVPNVTYDRVASEPQPGYSFLDVDPGRAIEVPFYVRF